MDQHQRNAAQLIAETQRLIDEGAITTPTDVADHLTHEEIATIADWLVQHFANQRQPTTPNA